MLKGNQTIIGLEKYENEATHNTHVNAEKKKNKQKLGFLGNGITYARTNLRTHEFSLHAQA